MLHANTMRTTAPAHAGLSGREYPLLRGNPRDYAIAKADQIKFTEDVVRFGFHPTDFALDIVLFRGRRSTPAVAVTFAMTVEHLRSGGCATYIGGPGRPWVTEFVLDLIAGKFGRP